MEGERDGDQVVHDIIELRVGVYYGYKEPPEGGGLFKELSPRRSFEDFADLPGRRHSIQHLSPCFSGSQLQLHVGMAWQLKKYPDAQAPALQLPS